MMEAPVLEGRVLRLRPINAAKDSDKWLKVTQDKEMHLWTGNTVPAGIGETKEYLERLSSIEGIISWAVARKDNDEILGTYWIAVPQRINGKSIITAEAQRISRECWRTGVTSEARRLIYDFAFKELGADEIYAQAWSDNVNSCRSMEETGFVLVKEEEKTFTKYDRQFTEREYVLSRDAWMGRTLQSRNLL